MPVALTFVVIIGTLTAAVLGLRELLASAELTRALTERVASAEAVESARRHRDLLGELDRRLRPTRLGRMTAARLARAGVSMRPAVVVVISVGLFLAVLLVLGRVLPLVLALPLAAFAASGPYLELRRRQVRRLESFIAQLPDLARLLSNATNAGLSLRSAIELAAQEMPAPAGAELRTVAAALSLGGSLADALGELEARLPSRELSVLVGTLIISSRSGGSVVTALRNIAVTLDQRKEVRREVRTLLAQALASSYLVATIGLGIVIVASITSHGLLHRMTTAGPGRLALIAAMILYVVGFALVRRITKVRV